MENKKAKEYLKQFRPDPLNTNDIVLGIKDGKSYSASQIMQLFTNEVTTSQQQTIERLRELCRRAYTAIRHETNPSNSMLDVYFDIEKEVVLNTTEPIENFYCEHQKNGFMRCSKKCLACSDDI